MKQRLSAAGLCGKALDLTKDYLIYRSIRVVLDAVASAKAEIFSGVPQGGKLSPKLWNFDIRDLSRAVGEDACLLAYVDDCNVWFEIDALVYTDHQAFIDHVNTVLSRLRIELLLNQTKWR